MAAEWWPVEVQRGDDDYIGGSGSLFWSAILNLWGWTTGGRKWSIGNCGYRCEGRGGGVSVGGPYWLWLR
jgi:hypothetical protein